jgi:hypothetical protein
MRRCPPWLEKDSSVRCLFSSVLNQRITNKQTNGLFEHPGTYCMTYFKTQVKQVLIQNIQSVKRLSFLDYTVTSCFLSWFTFRGPSHSPADAAPH